jgi:CDP-glycerol glycerophosphotransferase (TagB/SpsB family)
VLNRKPFYYLYDYETYVKNNGVNIDLEKEMPGCVFYDADSLIQAIESGRYNQEALKTYREHSLPINLGYGTHDIAELILQCCRKQTEIQPAKAE